MSHRKPLPLLSHSEVIRRAQRVFSVQYFCEECDAQWIDEMLTVSHSWCPTCDKRCEPDGYLEHEEERPEFDVPDKWLED